MTSTAASPLPIPFSRSKSTTTNASSSSAQSHQFRAFYHSSVAHTQAASSSAGTASAAAAIASSSSSPPSMSSSLGSSASSSHTPHTPTTEMPALATHLNGSANGPTADSKVKSSAAKRASAKAAAAAKKAATATTATTAASSSLSSRSNSAGSPTPTPSAAGDDGAKDWVVPQRAKPGRKPSQEEPLTKRQAQNRASQRAFRERKQNHVATLEAKVAEYEAEKLARDGKEAEAQRKLKERNAALESENTALQARVRELESMVSQMQLAPSHDSTSQSQWSPCQQAGCRAPSHESIPAYERRKRPLPSRTPSSGNEQTRVTSVAMPVSAYGAPSPTDHISSSRFGAMSIAASSPPFQSQHTGSSLQLTPSLFNGEPSRNPFDHQPNTSRRASSPDLMPSNDIDMDRDCGFCTDSTPCLCRGEAVLDLTGMDSDDSLNGSNTKSANNAGWLDGVDQLIKIEEEEGEDEEGFGRQTATSSANVMRDGSGQMAFAVPRRPAVTIPSLLSSRPKASTKPKLWSTTTLSQPQQSRGLASAAGSGAKLSTTAALSSSSSVAPTSASNGKRLWWTQPLSSTGTVTRSSSALYTWTPNAEPEDVIMTTAKATEDIDGALCSGDPSNCPACNADPALAAFCEAVGDDGASEASIESSATATAATIAVAARRRSLVGSGEDTSTSTAPKSNEFTFAIPGSSRPSLPGRSLTTGSAPAVGATTQHQQQHGGYSIPDAFRQIRSHPGFPKWQGGLNLLADVVSGRDHHQAAETSPPSSSTVAASASVVSPARWRSASSAASRLARQSEEERRRARHPSVEIVASSSRQTGLAESGDRDVIHDDDDKRSQPGGNGDLRGRLPSLGGTGGRQLSSAGPPSSLVPLSALGAARSTSSGSAASQHHKRRRLYLENDRVEEALRLLDFGVVGGGGSQRLPINAASAAAASTACADCPCPCPWARGNGGDGEDKNS